MSLFDPFADMTRLRRQIGQLLDENAGLSRSAEGAQVWRPPVDLVEDRDALTLLLDLPAIDRDSLDIQLTEDELRITGERKWKAPEGGACVHAERPHGQFHRAFRIGVPVKNDAVEATYRDGVLTVRLPKAEEVKPRKVVVKSETD